MPQAVVRKPPDHRGQEAVFPKKGNWDQVSGKYEDEQSGSENHACQHSHLVHARYLHDRFPQTCKEGGSYKNLILPFSTHEDIGAQPDQKYCGYKVVKNFKEDPTAYIYGDGIRKRHMDIGQGHCQAGKDLYYGKSDAQEYRIQKSLFV